MIYSMSHLKEMFRKSKCIETMRRFLGELAVGNTEWLQVGMRNFWGVMKIFKDQWWQHNFANLSSFNCTLKMSEFMVHKSYLSWVPVAHACNPSYSGARDQEDWGSKPTQANSLRDSILKTPITKKAWWSDSRYRLWVQISVLPKNR
jgi:hypothetical protein